MVREFRYLVKPPEGPPTADFTLEADVIFDTLVGQSTIYSHYNAYTGNNRSVLWDFISGNQLRLVLSKDGGAYVVAAAPFAPTPGQLYRLAADRQGSVVKLWADGIQLGGGIQAGALRASPDDQFVGASHAGSAVQNLFQGTILGFRRTLDQALYQAGGYTPPVELPLWG